MKAIIACLICAVAIGCIGLAPSKAEAGWYGRGVGISIGIGPRYGYYGYRYRPYGYYGYGYRPYGYTASGTDPTDITAIAPIADTGQAVQLVAGSDRFRTSVHFGCIERLVRLGPHFALHPSSEPGRPICGEV